MSDSATNENLLNFDLIILDEVDSTNDELRRLLASDHDKSDPSVIRAVAALRQTQGRGRLGRVWESPKGGLYLSLALTSKKTVQDHSALSLVVALGVRKALSELAGLPESDNSGRECPGRAAEPIGVKWPNDILCSDGKLVGILIEMMLGASAYKTALVGVGINLKRPAEGACATAAYLSDLTATVPDIHDVAISILMHIAAYYRRWQNADYTFDVLKDEYIAHLTLMGEHVRALNSGTKAVVEGVVQGVDSSGFLLVDTGERPLTRLSGGEVTLRA